MSEPSREGLHEFLTRQIAAVEGVPAEAVTSNYISARRATLYRDKRQDITSTYGGYSAIGLTVLTDAERDELIGWLEQDDEKIGADET